MNYATIIQWSCRKVCNKEGSVVGLGESFFCVCAQGWLPLYLRDGFGEKSNWSGEWGLRSGNMSVTITRTGQDRRAWQTITSNRRELGKMGQEDVSAPIWSGHGKGKLAPDPGDSLSNYRGCILRQQQSPASHFLADIPCNWKLNYDDDGRRRLAGNWL